MLEPRQNRAKGCWKRKTCLEKALIPCCLVLCVLAVVFLYLYITKEPGDVCTSKYCVRSAAELLDFADFKENPCDDFYKFTCGHFYKNAVKKRATTPLVSLTEELENELKSIVVDPIRKKNPPALILMKTFYQQCMDEKTIDNDHNKAFLKAINELGGWPLLNGIAWNNSNFDWVDMHIKANKLGLPIFGFFTFDRVTTGGGNTILKVAGRSAESDFYVSQSKYKNIMEEVMEYIGVSDTNGSIKSQNKELYIFRDELGMISLSEAQDLKVKTLQDMQQECPSVPWLKLLNSLADSTVKLDNSSKVVYGLLGDYCDDLNKLLNKTSSRTIANYFIWSILHQTYKFLDLRDIYAGMNYDAESRFSFCYEEVDKRFKYLKETIYIRKKTPRDVREDLNEMIDIMKEVFKEHLDECDWMDPKTKETALRKTEQIESMIGGYDSMYNPEFLDELLGVGDLNFTTNNIFQTAQERRISESHHFFKTLYMDEDPELPDFFENLVKVNAFFAPTINTMILPAPILNSLFYGYRKPAFMNYGSIGRIIAHEIMHGFEKSARYVTRGGRTLDWWTNATADGYDKKVQCVIDNYEKIPFRYRLNGTLTLDENVSDFVGIDVAYEAYLRYIERHGAEKNIPGVPLTPKQMFWVQTGTWLCFRKLDDSDIDYEEEDEHAIPGFRVKAGARNSVHFAKDFNCPEGSFMHPKDKCRVL